ncbi:hypothetical protein HYPGJ_30760 [Hyphomicrobium sp. GJ21]|nr:hypothetical protein HYPGJ_30760 [Hyphomicrobium sp. GJ21]
MHDCFDITPTPSIAHYYYNSYNLN